MTFLLCLVSFIGGMIASAVFFMAALLNGEGRSPESVSRTMQRMAHGLVSEKGAILYPKSYEQDAMEELFERNDTNGEDTEIGKMEGDGN